MPYMIMPLKLPCLLPVLSLMTIQIMIITKRLNMTTILW